MKSETRNPKPERRPKCEGRNPNSEPPVQQLGFPARIALTFEPAVRSTCQLSPCEGTDPATCRRSNPTASHAGCERSGRRPRPQLFHFGFRPSAFFRVSAFGLRVFLFDGRAPVLPHGHLA